MVRVLFIGDIVGRPGQEFAADCLRDLIPKEEPDLVIANGENATHGKGLNSAAAEYLYDIGVELITLGTTPGIRKSCCSLSTVMHALFALQITQTERQVEALLCAM